jgi:hypothetical protein
MQLKIPLIETIAAHSSQTEQMSQIFLLGIHSHYTESIGNDYVSLSFHIAISIPKNKNSNKYGIKLQAFPIWLQLFRFLTVL